MWLIGLFLINLFFVCYNVKNIFKKIKKEWGNLNMGYRILHCGKSIRNLKLCIKHRVAGFTKNIGKQGDVIYLAVRLEKEKRTVGIARGILGELTDLKPWPDGERYPQVFKIEKLELGEVFDLSILKEAGGTQWVVKYIQGSKEIKDESAIQLLNEKFNPIPIPSSEFIEPFSDLELESDDDFLGNVSLDELGDIPEQEDTLNELEPSITELDIMGTFQTIRFKNETDQLSGLEPLVNRHFFQLFQHFTEERTVMISDNRLFGTTGIPEIKGVKGIPDAVLISYDKAYARCPLRINIIEYECYGESKVRASKKFNYLNGVVIPQLIRFASAFSVVTDGKLRETTIDEWLEKIMDIIDSDDELVQRVHGWLREIYPDIKERQLDLRLQEELKKAFEENIRILLVIDELTNEQRETIKNVIQSFKLSNGESIEFSGYVVRLEQRLNIFDSEAQYALSIQE